jgi:hypothetical protein
MILPLLLACSGNGGDSAPGDDTAAPTGRAFTGAIVDHRTGEPIPDADICLFDDNVCQQTGADGSFTLFSQRADDTEFALLVAEPGWLTLTVPFTVPQGDGPSGIFEMWSTDDVDDGAKSATLLVTAVDGGLPNGEVTISVEGAAAPVTTGASGEALFEGLGDDGSATITTDPPCTGVWAWEAMQEGAFRANLEIGRFFSTRLNCE